MKRQVLIIALTIIVLSMFTVMAARASTESDLAELRAATAQFHRLEVAQAAGYNLVPGLDYCFDNPGIGAMGYHYINVSFLDTTVDFLQPEAMVFTPGPDGLQLGAVEYVVPAAEWDAEYTKLPQVIGREFHFNPSLDVYVLHIWIWKHNPAGMFEDWNPTVSCP